MKCLILLKNADITLEENKMSPNDIYQKYRYHYSPECSKYQHYLNLFNTLDDSELELFKSAYNDRVSEELDEIRDLIDYIYNDIYIKSVFQIEAPLLHNLNTIKVSSNSNGVHILTFEEMISLYAAYKDNAPDTAFVTNEPLKISLNLDFCENLKDAGKLFVLGHEAQHVVRYHFERCLNRDNFIWNYIGDLIINHSLLYNKLPHVLINEKNNHIHKIKKSDLFIDVNRNDLNFIGFKNSDDENSPLNDSYKLLKKYVKQDDLIEEELYEKVIEFFKNKENEKQNNNSQDTPSNSNGQSEMPSNDSQQSESSSSDNEQSEKSSKDIESEDSNDDNENDLDEENSSENNSNKKSNSKDSNDSENSNNSSNDEYKDIESHVKDGKEIFDDMKNALNNPSDNDFDKKDKIDEYLKKFINDYGTPKDKKDESKKRDFANDVIDLSIKETEKIIKESEQSYGFGTGDLKNLLKRKKSINDKLNFVFDIESMIINKNLNYGSYRKGTEDTSLARLTKSSEVNTNLLGIGTKLNYKRKEFHVESFKVLVIVDTSASVIEDEKTNNYLNQISSIIHNSNAEVEITYISADTEAKISSRLKINLDNIDYYEKNGYLFEGGGGTDMLMPLATEFVINEDKFDAIMIFSDGGYKPFTKDQLTINIMNTYELLMNNQDLDVNYKNIIEEKMNDLIMGQSYSELTNSYSVELDLPNILLMHTRDIFNKELLSEMIKSFEHNQVKEYVILFDSSVENNIVINHQTNDSLKVRRKNSR